MYAHHPECILCTCMFVYLHVRVLCKQPRDSDVSSAGPSSSHPDPLQKSAECRSKLLNGRETTRASCLPWYRTQQVSRAALLRRHHPSSRSDFRRETAQLRRDQPHGSHEAVPGCMAVSDLKSSIFSSSSFGWKDIFGWIGGNLLNRYNFKLK
jgi:hypothetical protein